MNKYDKIYVQPDEDQEILGSIYALHSNDGDGDGQFLDDLHPLEGPIIVMTIPEANEFWKAALDYQRQGPGSRSFSNYLQEKGIEL